MNINSFALFGDKLKWCSYLPAIIRQHHTLYYQDDWQLHLHVDTNLSNDGYCGVLKKMHEEGIINVKVVEFGEKIYQQRHRCTMMLWRLLPIWDNVDYVFCRDLDSILTPRQLQCVRSFMQSNSTVHGIQDNASHCIPLMGGMCGFAVKKFKEIFRQESLEDLMIGNYRGTGPTTYGHDQDFLMGVIWPYTKNSSLIHKLPGPNERSHLKNATNADINDIPDRVRNEGDNFTNYIGAVGCQTPLQSYTVSQIVEFYNNHGNQKKCRQITKIENDLNYN